MSRHCAGLMGQCSVPQKLLRNKRIIRASNRKRVCDSCRGFRHYYTLTISLLLGRNVSSKSRTLLDDASQPIERLFEDKGNYYFLTNPTLKILFLMSIRLPYPFVFLGHEGSLFRKFQPGSPSDNWTIIPRPSIFCT